MKKDYFKPAMRVVVMKQKCHILAGSVSGVRSVSTNLTGDDAFIFDEEGSSGSGR